MTTILGVISGAVALVVLAYSAVEQAATVAMGVVAVVAFVGLILSVVANHRMDVHLREAHRMAGSARAGVQEIIATARDDDPE